MSEKAAPYLKEKIPQSEKELCARVYINPERTKKILGNIKGIRGNILGALLGTIHLSEAAQVFLFL